MSMAAAQAGPSPGEGSPACINDQHDEQPNEKCMGTTSSVFSSGVELITGELRRPSMHVRQLRVLIEGRSRFMLLGKGRQGPPA